MLVSRLLEPSADDIFYHYCSTETFHAICEWKTVRFSDINMMNDFQEARWSYRIFEQAATELLNSKTIAAQYPKLGPKLFRQDRRNHCHPADAFSAGNLFLFEGA